ncbi:MAG: ShlB/FhaC/HecB family hemolysin secretion/activation protein [Candidatus Omnitrophota bacterium]|jgi:hemolysin activation/secretion protein
MSARSRFVVVNLVFLSFFIFAVKGFAQTPSSQTAGGLTQQEKDIEKKRNIEKKIEAQKASGVQATEKEVIPDDSGPKVMVNTITVEGATLIDAAALKLITANYEGKSLSFRTIQKIADLITDEYRKKGYVTSRAYIPPQNVKSGSLIVRVVEGKLGTMEIKGNKYFKTSLLEKRINVSHDGYFDYSALQRSLVYINEHPDRNAKAVIVPGKTPGTTDVVIDVTDRLPLHAGFTYDNYASRYLERNRYSLFFENNNLLGFDDKLYVKVSEAESGRMHLQQGRYSAFIQDDFEIGAYMVNSRTELGKEFKDLDAMGKAQIYGIFLNNQIIRKDNFDLRLTTGFDYKNIKNYLSGSQTSKDMVRLLKLGLDADITDTWGRTIINPEIGQGLPDFMGGMDDKDPGASRAGAGGKFTKLNFNLYRLQALPYSTTLLWKNNGQFTNNALVASEQFQIGGPISVRGYGPAEFSGDRGFYSSPELSFPIYGLSKNFKVPFSDVAMYDANRLVLFYDWATTRLETPQAGEKKNETIRGWGFGWRFTLKDNLSCRVELGYPLGKKTPADGDHAHTWVEITAKF